MPACAVRFAVLRVFSDTEDCHCLSSGRLKLKSDNYEVNRYKKNQTPESILTNDRNTYHCDTKIKRVSVSVHSHFNIHVLSQYWLWSVVTRYFE